MSEQNSSAEGAAARPERVEGYLAASPYQSGDPLPAVGTECLVSGVHGDIESDQHRGYLWRTVIGYSVGDTFICLQTRNCWPTVERLSNCWFAEVPTPRAETSATASVAVSAAAVVGRAEDLGDAASGPGYTLPAVAAIPIAKAMALDEEREFREWCIAAAQSAEGSNSITARNAWNARAMLAKLRGE